MSRFLIFFLSVCFSGALQAQTGQRNIELGITDTLSPKTFHAGFPVSKLKGYRLVDQLTGKTFPAQAVDSLRLVCLLNGIEPGRRQFKLLESRSGKLNRGVKVTADRQTVKVSVDGKPVFSYHLEKVKPPPDSPAYYERSGFIHPLMSPNGVVLTDDFPAGHAHQHGIFMTWVNTTFRGSKVDFWNQHQKTGTVEHVDFNIVEQGPVFTKLKFVLDHRSHVHGAVLRETWYVTIYSRSAFFLFDLESTQENITRDTLYLNQYHYGGLALRGNRAWNRHDTANYRADWRLLTDSGFVASNANHRHAEWVDIAGDIGNKTGGVTVFSHPDNFRHPQAIRVHPEMPYWCYAPVVDGPFQIAPAEKLVSKYRYFVHEGEPDTEKIRALQIEWAEVNVLKPCWKKDGKEAAQLPEAVNQN
jgi:hypothetical protein